jgi:SAM-dependent methyltransferase
MLRQLAGGRDTFARHLCVKELLRRIGAKTVIDIGGEGRLKIFVVNAKVSSANITAGPGVDNIIKGSELPFEDGSFDAAVSIDTLEHMPREARSHFIGEMIRIARKGLVLCAPLGTKEHINYEKQLLESGLLSGRDAEYLKEHVINGLPTPDELAALATKYDGKLFYQGDFRGMGAVKNGRARILAGNIMDNLCTALFWNNARHLFTDHTPYTNRFYFVINKY